MERETVFVDVIVPLALPNTFTYRVPTAYNSEVGIGKRVLVQFGKTRIYTAIIKALSEQAPTTYEAKYIEAVLDEQAVVNTQQLAFWEWIAFYYCATIGDVMNAALPSGLKLSSTSHVQLNPEFNFEESEPHTFTLREQQLIDELHQRSHLSIADVGHLLNIKTVQPLLNTLLKKNAISIFEEVKEKFKPKLETFYQLHPSHETESLLQETLTQLEKKAFKQAEALLYFLHLQKTDTQQLQWIKRQDILLKTDGAALNALVKKNILVEAKFDSGRLQFEKSNTASQKVLSVAQQQSVAAIETFFETKTTVLLHGVTGSGKTEVYIEWIKRTLAQQKQVLFLVPEIALTTQLITRLRAVFGEVVGIYHSRFSENERVEIWNAVLKAEQATYKVIIGARSSLFLPFHQLGLIIIDEEHDSSFKQHDPAPRYHARDAALYLANMHQAKVLMGSATPSLETYANAMEQKYGYVRLETTFTTLGGTALEICDLKQYEQAQQMKSSLTPPLFYAIEHALGKKEQVILFQNRRGFAPYTQCSKCMHIPHCVQCDVSLIYHKHTQKLTCHYCGYSINPSKQCQACGSPDLRFKGLGTEKIEEDIEVLFPKAKVARMDLDSTRSKHAYKQLIDDFTSKTIDILIGTQMVTKGLDFDNVTVVGLLNVDSLLNYPDFRSFERAFQLITQVRGRAGRKDKPGKVLVQTSQPQNVILEVIQKDKWESFYKAQLEERKKFDYPPYSRLIEINVIDKSVEEVNAMAHELALKLKEGFQNRLLGPEFPLVAKVRNQYYKRIVIKTQKTDSPQKIRAFIQHQIIDLYSENKSFKGRVMINVDPM